MIALSWFQAKGYTGVGLDGAMHAYFIAQGAPNTGINSQIIYILSGLGYTGDLNYMLKSFYSAKTGLPMSNDYDYLETQFYLNSTYDFVAGGGLVDNPSDGTSNVGTPQGLLLALTYS